MSKLEPTVLGRFKPPKSRGVQGFSFPVYQFVKRSTGKREKRVYLSWKTRKQDCAIEIKEWANFSWLPSQIQATAKPLLPNAIDITTKLLRRIGREQQQLWSNALQMAPLKRAPRPFDLKRKMQIEVKSKDMQRVSVPTCLPELVGVVKVRSEAAVILGPGSLKGNHKLMECRDCVHVCVCACACARVCVCAYVYVRVYVHVYVRMYVHGDVHVDVYVWMCMCKGTHKLMALRDGATFECSKEVIEHNDHVKARSRFARDHSNWTSQRSCSCQV